MAGVLPRNGGNKSTDRTGATVSRRLRKAGFNISPATRKYKHEGVFVTAQDGHVSILVDLGPGNVNEAVVGQLVTEVIGWNEVGDGSVDTTATEYGHMFVRFTYGR